MDFIETYLSKHNFQPYIATPPDPDLGICVVIPCYKEPDLIRSLQSLWHCDLPVCATEVIVVVNAPENCEISATQQNLQTLREAGAWIEQHNRPNMRFFLMYRPDLPEKFAGVGFARKIGMDEAACRLNLTGNHNGIITGFDADSLCDPNYLIEIEKHFQRFPKSPGASVYFEHPLSGPDFESRVYDGIARYELHLRYLNLALRYAGHPHAWHTVGSSFAVRVDAYVKQGGMNRRLAGEDFYFLQKIISPGNFSEINSTRVIPSPRQSDRVPFGTGASMNKWNDGDTLETYQFEVYVELKDFMDQINKLFNAGKEEISSILESLAPCIKTFLLNNDVFTELASISANCASLPAFRKRFFRWFNAFRVIKYLNFAHADYFEKKDVAGETQKLLQVMGKPQKHNDVFSLLTCLRDIDRNGKH